MLPSPKSHVPSQRGPSPSSDQLGRLRRAPRVASYRGTFGECVDGPNSCPQSAMRAPSATAGHCPCEECSLPWKEEGFDAVVHFHTFYGAFSPSRNAVVKQLGVRAIKFCHAFLSGMNLFYVPVLSASSPLVLRLSCSSHLPLSSQNMYSNAS